MSVKIRVLVVFGTRPEAIKLAPVCRELQRRKDEFECRVCVTAQHREMLDSSLGLFEIRPEYDLDLMSPNQTLAGLAAEVLCRLPPVLESEHPDLVLVQGDTTTTMTAALCAYYQRIAVGHVEAGLRSGDIYSPFPEEVNRRFVTQIARYHFAHTERARQNLVGEGIPDDRIVVSGNTVVDALLGLVEKARRLPEPPDAVANIAWDNRRVVLITGHRRESFGEPMRNVCEAFKTLANANPNVEFVYPVHLNPNVQEPVGEILSGLPNFHLTDPVDYLTCVFCLDRSHLVITDSGGIQEEAPALGKPVLVTRNVTERMEGIEAGTALLVGTNRDKIIAETQALLDDPAKYEAMSRAVNPYGDGHAAERIADFLVSAMGG